MFDFNNEIKSEYIDIETRLFGKKLVLKNIYFYDGPITLQYLPHGGIQAIFNDIMIINTKNGFIATNEVEYDGLNYTINEFSYLYNDLVNIVLPN